MRSTVINGFEVCWTEQGVWVNSPRGHNVARLGRFAREVHADEFNHCASCKLGRMEPSDWDRFIEDVFKAYRVKLFPGMRPGFLNGGQS
jgi:hypothetical protein